MKNKKCGFTLIELLVVVLIIGILAAIALPLYSRTVEKSRASEAMMLLSTIANANARHRLATGAFAASLADLDVELPSYTKSSSGSPESWNGKNFNILYYSYAVYFNRRGVADYAICRYIQSCTSGGFGLGCDKVFCRAYTQKGIEICQSATGHSNAQTSGDGAPNFFAF